MRIKPFRIENYFAKYEFSAQYLLASSDVESQTIRDVLDLEPGAHEEFLKQWCGYTEVSGAPQLREVIAGIYTRIKSDDVVVLSCAEEGIFVLYHALVNAEDHVIVETPCYESGLELARSTGAQVSEWRRRPQDGWAHDLHALEKLIQPSTKVLYVNTPHNPMGLLMPKHIFESVLQLAGKHGITVFCDEVYRELEHDPATLVLPQMWRTLGPLESIIGVLMCGLSVSFLFAVVSRLIDREARASDTPIAHTGGKDMTVPWKKKKNDHEASLHG